MSVLCDDTQEKMGGKKKVGASVMVVKSYISQGRI